MKKLSLTVAALAFIAVVFNPNSNATLLEVSSHQENWQFTLTTALDHHVAGQLYIDGNPITYGDLGGYTFYSGTLPENYSSIWFFSIGEHVVSAKPDDEDLVFGNKTYTISPTTGTWADNYRVPDSGSSALLAAIALGCVFLFHRRGRIGPISNV